MQFFEAIFKMVTEIKGGRRKMTIYHHFNLSDLKNGLSSAKLNSFICKKKSDFLTPLGPLGARPYRFEQK